MYPHNAIDSLSLKNFNQTSEYFDFKLELRGLNFKEGESLSLYTIENAKAEEIVDKVKGYLFKRVDLYSSYEKIDLKINERLILTRLTFTDEFISDKVQFDSTFEMDGYAVSMRTERAKLSNLIPYKINGNQYEVDFNPLLNSIDRFNLNGSFYTEELFGNKSDGLLYYLHRTLNKNASLVGYSLNEQNMLKFPEKLFERIDASFGISLKYLDVSSPKLFFIFKKYMLSISRSQIFENEGKECLRVFLDYDNFISNNEQFLKSIKIKVELFNKMKEVFYSSEIPLIKLMKYGKFIPPYFEIEPVHTEPIFSSAISIFINEQLHDRIAESYIRNINLNINIKKS